MKVTFWGVRGSIAVAGPQFTRVGGHTTCIEIEAEGRRLIIDAGTGIRGLGEKLSREALELGRPVDATLLFTHLHWDHVQGFPFFGPAFVPGNHIELHGPVDEDGTTLEDVLTRQMMPPTFPIGLHAMPAGKRFHAICSGDALELGPFTVRTRALSHPQGSLGYRIEAGGRSMCFATDTEHIASDDIDPALLELARDVDVLIYDAQYTEAEYEGREGAGPCRKGWGHSTYVAATGIARAVGANRLALFHHDPGHDDQMIDAIEREARTLFSASRAARETTPITV